MATWITVGLAGAILLLLAVAMAYVLGWANQALAVQVDAKVIAVESALPGANCGACGYVGCREYAQAVPKGESITKCTVGGMGCVADLAKIMGVEVEQTWPYRPVVHCGATSDQRLQKTEYLGEPTCASANLVAGVQGCTYGCLGLSDCVVVCDYDAIHIIDGLAVVDYGKCTGCAACAKACPRNIISMVPFKSERIFAVKCSNQDFGKEVKAVCEVGCIGCKGCAKTCDLFEMAGNLPKINYEAYDPDQVDFGPVLEKCPMNSLVWVGKPSEKDLAAVKDQEVPDEIKADFKTSVDDAEWRG
ncbi:MAG: RnfABCDGE type electron transport complex subunit B [Candidatus Omnitrophica bacterium]|nr:RnfABCDGE type electron transport complex subunit B [Candidatus Omnitrophota bacterium]